MAESPLAADSACATCRHAATVLAAGGCDPHDVCVTAVSGRRIDRFLRTHPEFAGDYLADGFWEPDRDAEVVKAWLFRPYGF